jgi:DNA-binding MarR family transcriptional regulator
MNQKQKLLEEVKRTIEEMVEEGTVQISHVDEEGNFCYSLTEVGRDKLQKLRKTLNEDDADLCL